jgi:glutaminyl-tRNA synthetase
MSDTARHPDGEKPRHLNFLEQIVEADDASGKWGMDAEGHPKVHTRFPPEPNGYLHIGHAKSICLNSGLARSYGGRIQPAASTTRNPAKEEQEYVDAIIKDVDWLTGGHGGLPLRRHFSGPVPTSTACTPGPRS